MSLIFDINYVESRNENSQLPVVVYHDSEGTPGMRPLHREKV